MRVTRIIKNQRGCPFMGDSLLASANLRVRGKKDKKEEKRKEEREPEPIKPLALDPFGLFDTSILITCLSECIA